MVRTFLSGRFCKLCRYLTRASTSFKNFHMCIGGVCLKHNVIDNMLAVATCRIWVTRGAHTLPHHLHRTFRPLLTCLCPASFAALFTARLFTVSCCVNRSCNGADIIVVFVHISGDVESNSCNAVHVWHANMKRS